MFFSCFWLLLGCFWPLLGRFWPTFAPSWAAFGRSWPLLGGPGATHTHTFRRPNTHTYTHGTTFKNHQKIDAKNDRFGPPKASQKPPKMTPKSDQKTIKNRCSKSMPKMTDLDSQKPPKMTPKSDQKTIKNRCRKRSEKRTEIRRT